MKEDATEAVTIPIQQVPPTKQQDVAQEGLHQHDSVEGEDESSSKASDLQDRRHGAYDSVSTGNPDDSLPDGLRRERKGPLSPTRGRSTEEAKTKP
ncbi:MAG TPA: hypothetical protein VLQ90_00515 [Pyrinomonadaceae bacterium]|nr:hypothetical protein [Pyrinomonadaceae bacterium]